MNVLEWLNLKEQVRRFLALLNSSGSPEPDDIRFSDVHDDQVRLDWSRRGMPLLRVYVRSMGAVYWMQRNHGSSFQLVRHFDLSMDGLPQDLVNAIKKVKETT